MKQRSVEDVLPVMRDMAGLELALAELYGALAERFPEDREMWLGIRQQEEGHAESIGRLADLIATHPEQFRHGRPFNSVAVRLVRGSVATYLDQAQRGQLPREKALFAARDIENSVLEANYGQIVSTDNVEYRRAMEKIAAETRDHRDALASTIAKLKR